MLGRVRLLDPLNPAPNDVLSPQNLDLLQHEISGQFHSVDQTKPGKDEAVSSGVRLVVSKQIRHSYKLPSIEIHIRTKTKERT